MIQVFLAAPPAITPGAPHPNRWAPWTDKVTSQTSAILLLAAHGSRNQRNCAGTHTVRLEPAPPPQEGARNKALPGDGTTRFGCHRHLGTITEELSRFHIYACDLRPLH